MMARKGLIGNVVSCDADVQMYEFSGSFQPFEISWWVDGGDWWWRETETPAAELAVRTSNSHCLQTLIDSSMHSGSQPRRMPIVRLQPS